jgi:hypothetical protein
VTAHSHLSRNIEHCLLTRFNWVKELHMAAKEPGARENIGWRPIFVIAGWAAILSTLLYFLDIYVLTTQLPLFETASQFFSAFEGNRIAGILQLFLTDLYGTLLFIPIAIALYAVLREINLGYAVLAAVMGLIGVTATLTTHMGYTMIALGERYATLSDAGILVVGDSVVAGSVYGTSFLIAGFLFECALLIFSFLMLRTKVFSRWLSYLGVIAHGLDTLHFLSALVLIPAFGTALADKVSIPFLAIGGTLQLIWYPWFGWRLLKLARE